MISIDGFFDCSVQVILDIDIFQFRMIIVQGLKQLSEGSETLHITYEESWAVNCLVSANLSTIWKNGNLKYH